MFFAFALLFSMSELSAQTAMTQVRPAAAVNPATQAISSVGDLNTNVDAPANKYKDMEAWALEVGARPLSVGGKTYYILAERTNDAFRGVNPGAPAPEGDNSPKVKNVVKKQ